MTKLTNSKKRPYTSITPENPFGVTTNQTMEPRAPSQPLPQYRGRYWEEASNSPFGSIGRRPVGKVADNTDDTSTGLTCGLFAGIASLFAKTPNSETHKDNKAVKTASV